MRTDYNIEDLVFQNENLVVYRVETPDGTILALVRLRYEDDILARLKEGRFKNALQELQSLEHQHLRSVLDGGLDPVDAAPWVAIRWEKGTVLTDRIKQGPLLSQEEYDRIKDQGSHLIEALGPVASTLSFTPESVVTSGTDPTSLIDTFSVDYHAWFHAFAQDIHPATLSASYQKFTALLTRLRSFTQHKPANLLTSDLAPPTQLSAIANPASTPTSNPGSNIAPLPSTSKSPLPLKALLLVGALLLGIGAAIWTLTQKNEPTPTSPRQASATSSQKETSPPPVTKSAKGADSLPRPKNFRFIEIQVNDPASLQKNLGQWVKVTGQITGIDPQGHLIFADSPLRAALPPKSQNIGNSSVGNSTTFLGFLKSTTLLKIEEPDDIDITHPEKAFYTIEDESELHDRVGEFIDFQGEIGEHRKDKRYHYLRLKGSSIQIRIPPVKRKPSVPEKFLKSLTAKKLKITGAKVAKSGSKLYLVVSKKSQFKDLE